MFAAYPDPKSNADSEPLNDGEPLFDDLENLVMAAQQTRAAGPGRQVGDVGAHRLG